MTKLHTLLKKLGACNEAIAFANGKELADARRLAGNALALGSARAGTVQALVSASIRCGDFGQ